MFRKLLGSLLLNTVIVLHLACGQLPPLEPPTPPDPPAPPVETVYTFGIVACDASVPAVAPCQHPIVGADIAVNSLSGYVHQTANGDGYALFTSTIPFSDVRITATGYNLATANIQPPQLNQTNLILAVTAPHFDPSGMSLATLAEIRGAMWPQDNGSCNLPYGPRPGAANNILATDFFANYSPEQQACILTQLTARGYTHVVVGPLVDSDGYHGEWTPNDWRGANFSRFLDVLQIFWDHHLAPIVFIHPDNWTYEQTVELTPLLQQPRAQQLIRIVVPTGWEPTKYGWSSCTWSNFFQWSRKTLPNALQLIHTVTDVDAPVGTDALCDDNGKPNGDGWARTVPYVHGWLIQNGAYATGPQQDPQLATNFCAQFQTSGEGATQHSIAWHFAGNAGWPTNSAWGNVPIKLYNGEVTSYYAFNNPMAESTRTQWGDLAIKCGAAGYLDGGTVAVPR